MLMITSFAILCLPGNAYCNNATNASAIPSLKNVDNRWQIGFGRRVITPQTGVWLAGWGTKREPEGKIHDIWVKAMAFKSSGNDLAVIITSDHMGMSKLIYERVLTKARKNFGLERSRFLLTFSHNHCGPRLEEDLVDYYPTDTAQEQVIKQYTGWMEEKIIEAVGDAVNNLKPAFLFSGEGLCTFAVNRRDNIEDEVQKLLEEGKPLKGVVDHYVPVLAARDENGVLMGVLFGYACHPTTLRFKEWNGDYPGFAQINLEKKYPGLTAMFFNTCGGDQNPLPRGKLEQCEKYAAMLSDAVANVLSKKMTPLSSFIKTAFEFVNLSYDSVADRNRLQMIAENGEEIQARWAKRMLTKLDNGVVFAKSYPYPVQAWQIGELLFISIGGEAVVDYSLRLKQEFGKMTWVSGYSNYMVAYIPSRRVWEEGGYEGGSHIDEYGHPAWRWAGDVEDRIIKTVHKVVRRVNKKNS